MRRSASLKYKHTQNESENENDDCHKDVDQQRNLAPRLGSASHKAEGSTDKTRGRERLDSQRKGARAIRSQAPRGFVWD
jgi:hypothetical protein